MIYIIGLIIIGQALLLVYEKYEHKRTIDKLTNALIAKTAGEFRDLNTVDKLKVEVQKEKEPDLTLESELSDKDFEKIINEEVA